MTLNRKSKSFRSSACAALVALSAGCSGINTSHSISPASFLLPGLLKADPPPAQTEPLWRGKGLPPDSPAPAIPQPPPKQVAQAS